MNLFEESRLEQNSVFERFERFELVSVLYIHYRSPNIFTETDFYQNLQHLSTDGPKTTQLPSRQLSIRTTFSCFTVPTAQIVNS